MPTLELFYSDLKSEAQQRYLDFYNLKTPEEGNLDIMPIAIFEEPVED